MNDHPHYMNERSPCGRCYSKNELALAYLPQLSPHSAVAHLRLWIRTHPTLLQELYRHGYTDRSRIFTPIQCELIFKYLGRPEE